MKKRNSGDPEASQLGPERIRAILEEYVSPVPDHIEDGVWKYMNLLELWREKIALTSIHDPEQLVRFHFGESIFGLLLMGEIADGRLADVGSGAGFPGLALKLAAPELNVILIEPNRKKSAFLHEVIRGLLVNGTEVISTGFESARIERASLSFVACRALGQHQAVLEWAKEKLRPNGSALLWLGREGSAEICHAAGWRWDEPKLIPRTTGRFILKGTPTG
jgi:16S rRNA (guanine527-N7)-methyltransferase